MTHARPEFDCVVADAAPRRLPRTQPRNGLALRGGAGDAGAKGERSRQGARPYRVRPRAGHRQVVLAAVFLGMTLPLAAIRYFVAAILIGLGIFCLVRHWHPRWVRMQVSFRDLTLWSFLMASAHGAGLMVVPVLLGSSTVEAEGGMAGPQSHVFWSSGGCQPAGRDAGHWCPYIGLSGSHRDGRLDGLSQARPGASTEDMVQLRLAVGRGTRGYGSGHSSDLAGCPKSRSFCETWKGPFRMFTRHIQVSLSFLFSMHD